jgi:hypothetical protein
MFPSIEISYGFIVSIVVFVFFFIGIEKLTTLTKNSMQVLIALSESWGLNRTRGNVLRHW